MGAWGLGIFENDDAAGFVADVRQLPGPSVGDRVVGAIRAVTLHGEQYLEALTVDVGLAALALLAAPEYPELLDGVADPDGIRSWWHHLDLDITPALRLAGRAALSRIAVPTDNEWFELRCDDEGMLPAEVIGILHRLSEAYA